MRALGFAFAFALATPAFAETDWARGLVTAEGLGLADRHAPTPAVAREPARRMAESAARKQLAAQLPALPLATGGTLKAKLGDKQLAAQIAEAVEAAITLEAIPHTDGSWNVTLAVPIEAVRVALAGPRKPTAADEDPAVIVVESVKAKPAIGYTVGGIAAPTVWSKDVPEWAKDAPRVKAKGTRPGAIDLAAPSAPQGGPATLFVLLVK